MLQSGVHSLMFSILELMFCQLEPVPTSEPTFPCRTATSIAISATSRSGVSTVETTASVISMKSDSLTEARLLLMYKSSTALAMLCMLDSLALKNKKDDTEVHSHCFFFFLSFSSSSVLVNSLWFFFFSSLLRVSQQTERIHNIH